MEPPSWFESLGTFRLAHWSILPAGQGLVTPGNALGYKTQDFPNNGHMTKATSELPDWGQMPTRPGLYLSLSHGRDFPQQAMRGRGFPGPKIGPVLYVRTQYGQEVSVRFANTREAKHFFADAKSSIQKLQIVEGTLVHGDKCFGDWDVCYIAKEFCRTV
ncbi:MAG: hypothetical protein KF740_15445 [Ramlibacter sp.]|nr:hypothetical protein [Ramlibacter sp.]